MSGGPPFSRETGSTFKGTCRAERTSAEVAFLERALDLTSGCRILDVPCGSGRLALPLAERGYRVTGVDITKALVQEALSTSREANLNLELRESDMRDLPWTETFDAAFCFWGSFGYFDDDGNRQFLEAVHRALKTGLQVCSGCFQPR